MMLTLRSSPAFHAIFLLLVFISSSIVSAEATDATINMPTYNSMICNPEPATVNKLRFRLRPQLPSLALDHLRPLLFQLLLEGEPQLEQPVNPVTWESAHVSYFHSDEVAFGIH
jgi:hypothetical protein